MVDVKEIKVWLKRADITQAGLAKSIRINPATLNRKINNTEGETLTIKEATKIAETLGIPKIKLTDIFFAP